MPETEPSYDLDSTIFSPDGRLFQVEYAQEVIKKGASTLGLKFKDGILLIVYTDLSSSLVEKSTVEKIIQIDEHIGCAFSGLVADAHRLIDIARDEAQVYKLTYDEKIPIKALVDIVSEYKHLHTQFDGIRPFGVTMIFAGVDEKGCHLFATDPSGSYLEYKVISAGKESDKISEYFEQNYQENISMEKAVKLGVQTIKKIAGKKFDFAFLELAVIDLKNNYRKLSLKELKDLTA